MAVRNQNVVCIDPELESIFTRIFAEGSPKAIGRGEMIGVIFQNPLENSDGNANANEVLIGSATNMIWLLLPGQESPLIYAEDQKDVYVKRNSASISDGAVLSAILEGPLTPAGGYNYTVGDILTLPGGDGNAQITVDTVDADGTILTFTISAPGTNYATGIETATGGTGEGAVRVAILNTGGAGYAPTDTFDIDGGTATGEVDTVDGGGAVLTFHITNRGAGYTTADGVTTTATAGIGAGLTLDLQAISAQFNIETVQTGNDVTCLIYRKRKGGRQ